MRLLPKKFLFSKIFLTTSMVMASLPTSGALASSYDTTVLNDRPVLFLPMDAQHGVGVERDLVHNGRNGKYLPEGNNTVKTRMPNGDLATVFDGGTQYLEVASAADLSIPRNGALTLEAWIRPDTLDFPAEEGDGYVYWAGKGESGEYEYAGRMYSYTNSATPSRPNRISGYVFNLGGGLGSGSYFQDTTKRGEWIHVALVVDNRILSGNPSSGTVSIFKNGILRKTTPLSQFNVHPEPGQAPLRIATRDLHSFFKGAIGKFALYAYALSEAQLKAHFLKMK